MTHVFLRLFKSIAKPIHTNLNKLSPSLNFHSTKLHTNQTSFQMAAPKPPHDHHHHHPQLPPASETLKYQVKS